jgi:hypothetical protein
MKVIALAGHMRKDLICCTEKKAIVSSIADGLKRIETPDNKGGRQNKKLHKINCGIFYLYWRVIFVLATLYHPIYKAVAMEIIRWNTLCLHQQPV